MRGSAVRTRAGSRKRTGAIASGITIGLLALSPLAWAGGGDGHNGDNGQNYQESFEKYVSQEFSQDSENDNENELVSVDNNNVQVTGQACDNNVPVNVLGVQVPVQDIAGILGFKTKGSQGEAGNTTCTQTTPQVNAEDNDDNAAVLPQ